MKHFRKYYNRIENYIHDSSIDIKNRTFILFSIAVLIALYVAIPCGLIMKEPVSATISTVVGAVIFTVYLIYSFKKNCIVRAKTVISFVLIFLFLPAMFFTNGGAEAGAPVWLLLGTFYITMILEGRFKLIMLACEAVVLGVCWVLGFYFPKLVTEYSRAGNYFDSIAGMLIVSGIICLLVTFYGKIISRDEESKNVQRLFAQTAMALVNAIDAKDKYTHGHSSRVAEYSKKIAQQAGKSPAECEEIYYVALLHDVGKIGIPEAIINKEGKLTDEEFNVIKGHSELGAQILQSITEYPYISIGAHFHHERYDGKGYPMGMKGTDIPEIARIISVADSYDAMTSKRSYRDVLTQDKVREELIKGTGTQFDPEFANIMLHLMDLDTEYEMREREEIKNFSGKTELVIKDRKEEVAEGIWINQYMTTIDLTIGVDKKGVGHTPKPSLILFDALDGRYHDDPDAIKALLYFEYCELWFDGRDVMSGARKIEKKLTGKGEEKGNFARYRIEACRVKDHAWIRITGQERTAEFIVALPDATRYAYIGLTGEHCRISNVRTHKAEEVVKNSFIPRIAEEISYINVPSGDIPNVQVDGYRTDSTEGIPVKDGMSITFHTKSLPTARLVWHCPSYVIFSAKDGKVFGEGYQEFSLVRLDGEYWQGEHLADNELNVNRQDFKSWDDWRNYNLEGYECTITFSREGKRIVSCTENEGIAIRNITEVKVDSGEIYVAISGDQVALTNIRIH
jgi:HD superfamily phosphodiesterase